MDLKLAAIDLDGTLLKEDCTISERNRKAICRAMELGYLVVPSTGRGYRNSRFVLEEFPAMPYYINANGTTVTRGEPEEVLLSKTISLDTGREIYRIAREYPAFIELYHGLDAFDSREGCEKLYKSGVMEAYCRQLLKTNIHLDSLDDFVLKEEHLISKFHIVCVSKKDKEELMERLGALEGVFPISTASQNIEIADTHWSKKDGLAWLCGRLKIDASQVLAIGDSENDYEQIRWAGVGVAVKNAYPRVIGAADALVASNEEDGVAQALEQFLTL